MLVLLFVIVLFSVRYNYILRHEQEFFNQLFGIIIKRIKMS